MYKKVLGVALVLAFGTTSVWALDLPDRNQSYTNTHSKDHKPAKAAWFSNHSKKGHNDHKAAKAFMVVNKKYTSIASCIADNNDGRICQNAHDAAQGN